MPPDIVKEELESMNGSFKGIGIESIEINDTVSILTLFAGLPASKAGLQQFDQILAIDDTIVAGKKNAYEKVRKLLRREDKTSVKIEVERNGKKLIKIVKIDDVALHSANNSRMISKDIGLIQIDQFSANTYSEFMESLEDLVEKNGMKHLVIDLRGNPGGYLPQATKILNQLFKEKDRLMLYTKGRSKDHLTEYKTTGKVFFPIDKIYVLVDENSASGAEIIAGVLQDWDRATIIGRRTFGKGLVQEQFNLSNGGAIRLTTSKYYLASGRSIQRTYKDKSDYYNDIERRLSKGQLFKHVVDTSTQNRFKTLEKGRIVYGGRGVDPDVFVPADSSLYSEAYYKVQKGIRAFVFDGFRKGKIGDQNFLSNKALQEVTSSFIKSQAPSSGIKSLNASDTAKLAKAIQTEYQYILNNGDLKKLPKYMDEGDLFIQKVLQL
jgi:carboxyl-terminal processing protease